VLGDKETQGVDIAVLSEKVEKLTDTVNGLESRLVKLEQTKSTKTVNASPNIPITEIPPGEKILWKKVSGGSLRIGINGKIIKPNQTFHASVDELPKTAIKNRHVIPVGGEIPQKTEEPVVSATGYEIKEISPGWFNVFNVVTGKPMQDKKIRKQAAEKLLEDLLV
jgi:hypothetical protein